MHCITLCGPTPPNFVYRYRQLRLCSSLQPGRVGQVLLALAVPSSWLCPRLLNPAEPLPLSDHVEAAATPRRYAFSIYLEDCMAFLPPHKQGDLEVFDPFS